MSDIRATKKVPFNPMEVLREAGGKFAKHQDIIDVLEANVLPQATWAALSEQEQAEIYSSVCDYINKFNGR